MYSVINVRANLEQLQLSRSLRRVFNRGQRRFRVEIGRAQVDPARERLYALHKKRFKGFIFESLDEFLFGGVSHYLFDTHEVAVYDEDRLVAVSYFDRGENAIASLIGLYERGFERYSLGVFTMLHEIQFARSLHYRFYYPGYVLQGYHGFDYKLRIGDIQYYNWNGRWRPLDRIDEEEFTADRLKRAISVAEVHLKAHGLPTQRVIYPFFSVGYLGMTEENFVRSALFLEIPPPTSEEGFPWLLEYILEDDCYLISRVHTDRNYMDFIDANFSEDFFSRESSQTGLYVREKVLYRSREIAPIIKYLRRIYKPLAPLPKRKL